MLIPQGGTQTIAFFVADTNLPNGVPNIPLFTLLILQNGVVVHNSQDILTNPIGGWYWFNLGPPITNTLGQIAFQATGQDPINPQTVQFIENDIQVVPAAMFNPGAGGPIAIQRNQPLVAFPFPMYSNLSPPVLLTGLSVSGQRSLDGGAFVTLAGPITEIGSGWYSTPLTAAETNGAMIAFRFSAPGAQDTGITIATQP